MNGQKQSHPAAEGPSAQQSVVLSEALAAKISELRERAKLDVEALRLTATQAADGHSPEQVLELDPGVTQMAQLVKQLQAEVDQVRAEVTLVGEAPPSLALPDPANFPPQFDRRALLISLNMASNGASRSEAADYLAKNLNLRDCDELLDAVFGYVASTRTGRRDERPAA